ncbi:unnamed protein product [Meganyctiphanes norvegica]|uniref:RWD domain-containing protein n=1 Tax=Meganyctiphanes norvegica TaxID=48144 RepID=A0AAV2R9M0_MEGNR
MSDDNLSRQHEEIEALSAIYGLDFHTESYENRSYSIEIEEVPYSSFLQVTMPPEYPSLAPPIYMLSAPWLKGHKRQELCGYLEDIFLENVGESIVYLWVERIREFMVEEAAKLAEEETDSMSSAVESLSLDECSSSSSGDRSPTTPTGPCPDIHSGEIITDRKSHFQPFLAQVSSKDHIQQVLSRLYENKKIASATHNMYAYRFLSSETGNIVQDCEDDGETHSGGRMLHLLQIVDVQNVLVVVTRWYGGIHLGPDRFKHINNAARQILEKSGYIKTEDKSKKSKKGK